MVTLLMTLAIARCILVPVCDGTPSCKQATPTRAAEREKKQIEAFHLQIEVIKLQQDLNGN